MSEETKSHSVWQVECWELQSRDGIRVEARRGAL